MAGTSNETSDLPDDTSGLHVPSHSSKSAHSSSTSNGSDSLGGSNNVDLHNSLKRSSTGLDSEQNENNNQCNSTPKVMKLQGEESVEKSLKTSEICETGSGGYTVNDSMMASSSMMVVCATNAIIDNGNINTDGRSDGADDMNNEETVQRNSEIVQPTDCVCAVSTCTGTNDRITTTEISNSNGNSSSLSTSQSQNDVTLASSIIQPCNRDSTASADGREQFTQCINACGRSGAEKYNYLCEFCHEEQLNMARDDDFVNSLAVGDGRGLSCIKGCGLPGSKEFNFLCKLCYEERHSQPVVDTTSNFATTSVSDVARSSSPVNTPPISLPLSSSSLFSDLLSRPVKQPRCLSLRPTQSTWRPSQPWHQSRPWLSNVPPGFAGLTNFNPGFNFGSTASSNSSDEVAITTLSSSGLSSLQHTSSRLVPLNVNLPNPAVTCSTVTSSSHVVDMTTSQQTVQPNCGKQVESSVARLGVHLCDVEFDVISGLMSFPTCSNSSPSSSSDIFRKIMAELVQLHNDAIGFTIVLHNDPIGFTNNLQPEQRGVSQLRKYLLFQQTAKPPDFLLKLLSSDDPAAAHLWQTGPSSHISNSSQPSGVAAAVTSQPRKTVPLHTPCYEGGNPTSDIQSSSAQQQQHSTQTCTHPSTISNDVESANREISLDFVLQGLQNVRRQWNLRDALVLFNLENDSATGLLRVFAPPATVGTSAMCDQDQLMALAHFHNELLMAKDYQVGPKFMKIRCYLLLGPNSGPEPYLPEGKTAAELAAVARTTWGWPSYSSNIVSVPTASASSQIVQTFPSTCATNSSQTTQASRSPNMAGASCSTATVTGRQHLTATGISSGATGGSACATFARQDPDHGKSKCIQSDNAGASNNKEFHIPCKQVETKDTDDEKVVESFLVESRGISNGTMIPSHWPGNCVLGQRIKAPQHAYNSVKTAFERTIAVPGITVTNVEEICNVEFFEKYEIQRRNMKQKLSGNAEVNERLLYHGTCANTIDDICVQNFDPRMSDNAAQWGKGSYFARDAAYSHSYSVADGTSTKYMFLARVLVGRSTLGDAWYLRPPSIPGQAHRLFDSCVNNIEHPSIFVIFDRDQCYPRYLISYKDNGTT